MKNALLLLFGGLMACNQKPADLAAVRDEMRAREVIHASQGDITEAAYEMGRTTADALEAEWNGRIAAALDSSTPDRALDVCRITTLPAYAAFTTRYDATVKRPAAHPFAPFEEPDPRARALFEAYLYGASADIGLTENVQRLNEDRTLLYTRPITFARAECLRCHGTVGREVDPATYAAITRRYSATDSLSFGGERDSLAGVWAIAIPKRQVVLSLGDN